MFVFHNASFSPLLTDFALLYYESTFIKSYLKDISEFLNLIDALNALIDVISS